MRIRPKTLIILAVVLLVGLLVARWQWQAAEDRRRAEEIATAEGIARVLNSTFAGRTDLKVSTLSGTMDVTTVDRGRIFDSSQKATLPFSVDYFVDLSGLNAADTRFNAASRVLSVEIPEVRVADPNVDLTKGKLGEAQGWWVSRRAAADLVQRALKLTRAKASEEANDPARIQRAREEARTRIQRLLEVPLSAAGYGDVRVVARFAGEAAPSDPSIIDHSRSYNEVLEEARQNRN